MYQHFQNLKGRVWTSRQQWNIWT